MIIIPAQQIVVLIMLVHILEYLVVNLALLLLNVKIMIPAQLLPV
jgi:hypothetical protein